MYSVPDFSKIVVGDVVYVWNYSKNNGFTHPVRVISIGYMSFNVGDGCTYSFDTKAAFWGPVYITPPSAPELRKTVMVEGYVNFYPKSGPGKSFYKSRDEAIENADDNAVARGVRMTGVAEYTVNR